MYQHKSGNYTSCCRLCLDDKITSLKSIFEDVAVGNELVQCIKQHVGIEVKAGDKLTTMICNQCLLSVHTWNSFKKLCTENQNKLKEWMDSWEFNNLNSEIQIKHEVVPDQFMEIDILDEPPLLTPIIPNNSLLNSTNDDISEENETDAYNKGQPIRNDTDPNSTICLVCDKNFSSVHSRRRHEKGVHKYDSLSTNKDPLSIVPKSTNVVDTQKIQFAAELQLEHRSESSGTTKSNFTDVEIAYLKKFKDIIKMIDTLVCVCHKKKYSELQGLFSHLKKQRSWFAMFTCYNCLITFCDRSSYMRHYWSCSKKFLHNLRRLSEFSKNSEIKIRIYQNFKCLKCNLIYTFYEDFCNHLDTVHMEVDETVSPYTCICSQSFDDAPDLKQHINISCFILYYCDVCFTSYDSINTFKNHCKTEHDFMDGSTLELYDYYQKSNNKADQKTKEDRISINQSLSSNRPMNSSSILEPEPVEEVINPYKVIKQQESQNSRVTTPSTCPDCDKTYSSHYNMLRHYRASHDKLGLILKCSDCSEKFRLSSELKEHEFSAHGKTFSCKKCGENFNSVSDLKQHKRVHLNVKIPREAKLHDYKNTSVDSSLNCLVCEKTFATKVEMLQHKLLHEKMPELSVENEIDMVERKRYFCIPCNKEFSSYTSKYHHNKKKHHNPDEVAEVFPKQCPSCDKVLLTRGAYGNHKRMHDRFMGLIPKSEGASKSKGVKSMSNDSESYSTCKKCFKVFATKSTLKNHMKSHGISANNRSGIKSGKAHKTYECDICLKMCISYSELEEHIQQHNQQKMKTDSVETNSPEQINPFIFVCDICSLSFSTNFALKRHREKHDENVGPSNTTTVYCKYCKIPFANIEKWNVHMSIEHDEPSTESKPSKLNAKSFVCKICKKVFDSGQALSSHQGWHKRGKFTSNPIKLETFQCSSCALQFVNETALQIHILETHKNIDEVIQLSCNSCCTNFDSKAAYDSHMQLHKVVESQQDPKKPFACMYCPAKFCRKDRLRGHTKRHQNEYEGTNKILKCTQCNRTFDKESALIIHLKVHERHRMASSGGESAKSTKKDVTNKNLYFCSICDLGFALAKDLRTHVITSHPF